MQFKAENNHIRAGQQEENHDCGHRRAGVKKLALPSTMRQLLIGTGTIMYEWVLFSWWGNGWDVVQRNVGFLCFEDSLGLRFTSFTEEEVAENGCFSLQLPPTHCQQNWRDYCTCLTMSNYKTLCLETRVLLRRPLLCFTLVGKNVFDFFFLGRTAAANFRLAVNISHPPNYNEHHF